MYYQENMSLKFSSKSEALASELLEQNDEMFPRYCVDHEQMTA